MRRGQLTLILIVVVLILISGAFVLYLVNLATPNPTEQSLSVEETRAATRLCLEQTGRQIIMQALAQGGVHEQYWGERGNVVTLDFGSKTRTAYQEGTDTEPERGEGLVRGTDYREGNTNQLDAWAPQEYIAVDNSNVRFWIFRGRDYINDWPATIEFTQGTSQTGPYLGQLRPEPLCANRGFNQRGANLDGTNSCLPGTYGGTTQNTRSWQETLEDSITAAIRDDPLCPIISPVTLAIGDDDVTLISGEESVTVPIRLKRMYNLAFNLAKYELADPRFNPATVTGATWGQQNHQAILGCQDARYGSDCAIPGLIVTTTTVPDVFENLDYSEDRTAYPWEGRLAQNVFEPLGDAWRQPATIVTITDTTSRIDGQNPRLNFAIKNRYPIALSGGTVTGDGTLSAQFTIGGVDPDGTSLGFACYTEENRDVLDICDGVQTGTNTAALNSGAVNTFCNNNRPLQACDVLPGCTEPVSIVGVRSIFCSIGERTDENEFVPIDEWLSWIEYPDDAIPRNCRVTYAPVDVLCLVARDENLLPEADESCQRYECPTEPSCGREPICIPW